MSSNRFVPDSTPQSGLGGAAPGQPSSAQPDYVQLLKFLIEPFLESPDSLKVDCEIAPSRARVWVRLAFEGTDRGRVFGRGGRNIQAVRTVLSAAAQAVGQSVHLDIYGGNQLNDRDNSDGGSEASAPKPSSHPSGGSKSSPKLRS